VEDVVPEDAGGDDAQAAAMGYAHHNHICVALMNPCENGFFRISDDQTGRNVQFRLQRLCLLNEPLQPYGRVIFPMAPAVKIFFAGFINDVQDDQFSAAFPCKGSRIG
jgi:hypothetical protein